MFVKFHLHKSVLNLHGFKMQQWRNLKWLKSAKSTTTKPRCETTFHQTCFTCIHIWARFLNPDMLINRPGYYVCFKMLQFFCERYIENGRHLFSKNM